MKWIFFSSICASVLRNAAFASDRGQDQRGCCPRREGKTNEAGEASERFRIEDIYKNVGLLQADFYSTVLFSRLLESIDKFKMIPIFN